MAGIPHLWRHRSIAQACLRAGVAAGSESARPDDASPRSSPTRPAGIQAFRPGARSAAVRIKRNDPYRRGWLRIGRSRSRTRFKPNPSANPAMIDVEVVGNIHRHPTPAKEPMHPGKEPLEAVLPISVIELARFGPVPSRLWPANRPMSLIAQMLLDPVAQVAEGPTIPAVLPPGGCPAPRTPQPPPTWQAALPKSSATMENGWSRNSVNANRGSAVPFALALCFPV